MTLDPVSPTIEAGTRLGSLKIIRPLGGPGSPCLYLARDMVRGGLRVLELFEAADRRRQRRLLWEGMALTGLRHPHLASVLEVIELTDRVGLVRDYVGGVSVRHEVTHRGRLPVDEAVDVVVKAAQGIACAHGAGVVHGQLDASQILLVQSNFTRIPRVVGVGTEALRARSPGERQGVGPTTGTPGFVAPELIRGDEDPMPAADVFSLGAVLYTALTGVPPFRGPTLRQSLSNTLRGLTPPLRELRPDCPSVIAEVVDRALCVRPQDRLRSAAALAQALDPVGETLDELQDDDFWGLDESEQTWDPDLVDPS